MGSLFSLPSGEWKAGLAGTPQLTPARSLLLRFPTRWRHGGMPMNQPNDRREEEEEEGARFIQPAAGGKEERQQPVSLLRRKENGFSETKKISPPPPTTGTHSRSFYNKSSKKALHRNAHCRLGESPSLVYRELSSKDAPKENRGRRSQEGNLLPPRRPADRLHGRNAWKREHRKNFLFLLASYALAFYCFLLLQLSSHHREGGKPCFHITVAG